MAMSIINSLHQRKIRTAVTTHYSELKVYALSTEGVENACCEFDVETYKAIKRNQVDMAVGVIEGYQLPMALEERINLLNRQMRFA